MGQLSDLIFIVISISSEHNLHSVSYRTVHSFEYNILLNRSIGSKAQIVVLKLHPHLTPPKERALSTL